MRVPIPPAPARRKLLEMYESKLKVTVRATPKSHYIIDQPLAEKIAEYAGDIRGCHVVENSPGPGLLTRLLLEKDPARVIAVDRLPMFAAPLQEIQKAVGPEKLHLFIPGTVHGLFADHAVLFEAMAGVKKGDWSTGELSGIRLAGMGYGGTTFEIFSRATNALVRRQDLYYAGPAEAVVCVRDVDFQKLEIDKQDMQMSPTSSTRARAMFHYLFDLDYLETCEDVTCTLPELRGPAHIVRFTPSERACKMSESLIADFSNLTFWLYSKASSPVGKLIQYVEMMSARVCRCAGPGAESLPALAGIDSARKSKTLTAEELERLLEVYHKWEFKQAAGIRL